MSLKVATTEACSKLRSRSRRRRLGSSAKLSFVDFDRKYLVFQLDWPAVPLPVDVEYPSLNGDIIVQISLGISQQLPALFLTIQIEAEELPRKTRISSMISRMF